MKLTTSYRKDIDGLRAIAVIPVLFFHLNLLPNGYLGVDIFFVISGFLITRIIYDESREGKFSIANFYLRRIRRIIPVVLIVCLVALLLGILFMLPDALENLGQSVVATNLFANNILEFISKADYWDIQNEYKPLMHTWSLGVEEQYYIVYPVLFLLVRAKNIKYLLSIIIALTVASVLFYIFSTDASSKFYLLQYRFFELSVGGIGSILLKDKLKKIFAIPLLIAIVSLLIFNIGLPAEVKLISIVLLTLALLITDQSQPLKVPFILENNIVGWIGKISFSLYMWHQLIFSFGRYVFFDTVTPLIALLLLSVTFIVSTLSYYFIEQPFRDKKTVSTSSLLWSVGIMYIIAVALGVVIHFRGGILKDYRELDIYANRSLRNSHVDFNMSVLKYEGKDFSDRKDKIKVLIIGSSFARDWANVLLESKYRNSVEISYIKIAHSFLNEITPETKIAERWKKADCVYFSEIGTEQLTTLMKKFDLDPAKYRMIGIKNFGISNGIFYNAARSDSFYKQRTLMNPAYYEKHLKYMAEYGDRYINIIDVLKDKDNKVPVFTPSGKFISQDCIHLTKNGAQYLASKLVYDKYFYIK